MSTDNDAGDPSGSRIRLALMVVASLLAAGVALGLAVSWLGTSALRAAGVDDDQTPQSATSSSPTTPARTSKPSPTASSERSRLTPSESSTPDRKSDTRPSRTARTRKPAEDKTPVATGRLAASAARVGSFEQVRLHGRLEGVRAGTVLRVERRDAGRWVRFPTTTTVEPGGRFTVHVALGQPGPNLMRVSVSGSARHTSSTTITVT